MITLLSFIFVLGVLVFVHELGHFLAAKRVGIRVLKFQLGFNPTIVSFKYGDTEYGIGALPLGGYVKMAGEANEDGPTGDPAEFLSKTRWQRFQVLVMGPVMNLLLAFVLAAAVIHHQGAEVNSYEDQSPTIGAVKPDSPAARADIHAGDLITTVAGHHVDTWQQLEIAIGTRANKEVSIGLLRNGLDKTTAVTPQVESGNHLDIGDIGVLPNIHPHLTSISTDPKDPGGPAGLKPGDVIVGVDGQPIVFAEQFREAVKDKPNVPITIQVLRNGEIPADVHVTPRLNGKIGYLGVTPVDDFKVVPVSLFGAVKLSARKNIEMTVMIGQTVWGLLTRELSPKQLMGPIAIAQVSGEAAKFGGLMALAGLMVSLSLNLGLLNLLPIPMLDGGHIFIMALEGLARRDFSVRVKEKMLLAGFVVLMMLMVTVIYNDLARLSIFDRLNFLK